MLNNRVLISVLLACLIYFSLENLIAMHLHISIFKWINYSILASLFISYFVLRTYKIKSTVSASILEVMLLAYITCCFASGISNKVLLTETLNSLLFEVKFIVLYLVLSMLNISQADYYVYLRGIFYWGWVQVLLGSVQYFGPDKIREFFLDQQYMSTTYNLYARVLETNRIVGTFLNKNIFAFFLLFNVVLLIKERIQFKNKTIHNITLFALLGGIVLSGSRTAWGLTIVIFLSQLHWGRKKVLLASGVIIAMMLTFFVTVNQMGNIENKASLLYKVTEIFQPEYRDIVVNFGRIAYIMATFEILNDRPLTGIGGGNWGNGIGYKEKQEYEHISYGSFSIPKGVMQDNNYASIAGQFGLIALAIFLMCIFNIKKSLHMQNNENNHTIQAMRWLITCLLLIALTWSPFASKPISFLFWSLLGLSSSLMRLQSNNIVVRDGV